MSLVTVFRIFNDKGRGFYHDEFNKNFPKAESWYKETESLAPNEVAEFMAKKHPHILIDENKDNSFVFGFTSAESMADWFPEHILKDITKYNGKIMMYKLPEEFVNNHNKQCAFNINEVVNVKEISFMDVIEMIEPLPEF